MANDGQDFRAVPPDSAVQTCPTADTCWIEIELVDEADAPVANAAYQIVLPNGDKQIGKTDANGRARVSDFAKGPCTITFPDLDSDCWQFIEAV